MPGYLLHVGATVLCAHGGQAQPTAANPRVKVMGQPLVTQAAPYTVAGCPFTTAAGTPQPCATAQWLSAAARVTLMGQPVLLQTSQATCPPNGTPVNIVMTQMRVRGM
jgi:hypothetical protein